MKKSWFYPWLIMASKPGANKTVEIGPKANKISDFRSVYRLFLIKSRSSGEQSKIKNGVKLTKRCILTGGLAMSPLLESKCCCLQDGQTKTSKKEKKRKKQNEPVFL